MANTVRRQTYNFAQIKRDVQNVVKARAINQNGIIFGGAVRDEIIADHYNRIYKQLHGTIDAKNQKNYWDASFHPETAARILNAEDIDVFFSKSEESSEFIKNIKQMCKDEDIKVVMNNNNNDDPSTNPRRYGQSLCVKKLTLTINVGKIPFSTRGYDIEFDVDVVTPRIGFSSVQPPFRNVDFLCNTFIKTKQGITLSSQTGTYLDNLSFIDRTRESLKIMEDMVQFKTYFCKFEKLRTAEPGTCKFNKDSFKRINKLLKKEHFEWTICNLPFEIQDRKSNV